LDKKEEVIERIWKALLEPFPDVQGSDSCLSCSAEVFNSWFCEECWPIYMEEWRRLIRRIRMIKKAKT
jgi:hypothetical protein